MACQTRRLWRSCVSAFPTRSEVGISVTQRIGVSQLFSGFLSEGIGPSITVYLVHLWQEGKSGASCLHLLNFLDV